MSGWIDPLGMNALFRHIERQQKHLAERAEWQERNFPHSRLAARYRARRSELSRMMTLLKALERPGIELLPFKDLVNQHADRRDVVMALVPRDVEP